MKKKIERIVSDAVAMLPSNKIILIIIVALIMSVLLYSVFMLMGSR